MTTTDTKPDEKTIDLNTADVKLLDYDKQIAEVYCPKVDTIYKIYKPRDNTAFFKVTGPNTVPKFLSGHFRSIDTAIEFIKRYNKEAKESNSVRQEILHRERQARNASKPSPKAD